MEEKDGGDRPQKQASISVMGKPERTEGLHTFKVLTLRYASVLINKTDSSKASKWPRHDVACKQY